MFSQYSVIQSLVFYFHFSPRYASVSSFLDGWVKHFAKTRISDWFAEPFDSTSVDGGSVSPFSSRVGSERGTRFETDPIHGLVYPGKRA